MNCPKRGDLIKCDFDNTAGHKQTCFRRALVISPNIYNEKLNMALVCSITNVTKGFVFEVEIPPDLKVTGVVLADQIRTIDLRARNVETVDRVPPEILEQVLKKVSKLIG